jgi:PTS system nitrogen regulatory IIA component
MTTLRREFMQRLGLLLYEMIDCAVVFMDAHGYLSLSSFHYESLPSGKVMDKIDKWLTIDELAAYIKMSRTKLYGMAQRGEVPASKIGNQWRSDREEIDQWMKAHATGKGETKA